MAQDHYEYEPISAYDARSYKKEEHELAVQQEHQDRLRNESFAWMAQHIIEQTDPYSFADSEEFKEFRNAMLTQSEDEKTTWLKKNADRIFTALYGHSMKKNTQDILDLSEAHIIMDNTKKGCGSINGVYMDFREIKSIGSNKDGNVLIEFRQDITDITVQDEFGKDIPWTKRLAEGDYILKGGRIKIEIPGNKCNNIERNKCIIHRYDAKGNEIGTPQTYPTENLRKIKIKYHGKDQGEVEQSVDLEFKTMPDGNMSLNQKIPYDKAKNAFRLNLRTGMLIMQDGQFTIPLNMLDLTETSTDKEKGTIFRTDKEWRPIPIEIIGSLNTHFKSMQGLRSEANTQAHNMETKMLDLLDAARLTNNPNAIADAFEVLDNARADLSTRKAEIVKDLQHVPANAKDLALRKEQQKFDSTQRDARDASIKSDVRENCKSASELTKAYNAEARSFTKGVMKVIGPELEATIENWNNSNDNKTKMQEWLNDIKKEGAFELDKIYGIDLSDGQDKTHYDMLEIAQKYEEHISQIKDLSEDYKEYVEKYINAGRDAIKNLSQDNQANIENYITNYIKSASMKIKDLSAEDQALIIEHADKYEQGIWKNLSIKEEEQNILREHAINYIGAMKGLPSEYLDFIQNHAKDYVNAEDKKIETFTHEDQDLVRKFIASGVNAIPAGKRDDISEKAINVKEGADKAIALKQVNGALTDDQKKYLKSYARNHVDTIGKLSEEDQKLVQAIKYEQINTNNGNIRNKRRKTKYSTSTCKSIFIR